MLVILVTLIFFISSYISFTPLQRPYMHIVHIILYISYIICIIHKLHLSQLYAFSQPYMGLKITPRPGTGLISAKKYE